MLNPRVRYTTARLKFSNILPNSDYIHINLIADVLYICKVKLKKHLIFANFLSTAEKFTYQVKRGSLPYVNRVNEREKKCLHKSTNTSYY